MHHRPPPAPPPAGSRVSAAHEDPRKMKATFFS
ncbi:hypothetical protein E2C01_064748 [Portunus trituberculatus]|uniref:Uncharacterized protein n=1 Tax=Portunus trituberculatus TaxID=210409 RepID=A0A5B7HP84_PORTR|nr:hypothetical protein [Portunus trituberculatus]